MLPLLTRSLFKKPLIAGLAGALMFSTGAALASGVPNPVHDSAHKSPLLNSEHNQDAVKSLKWLYDNDSDFHQLIDNMFANIHPLKNGKANPWQGKDINDLYEFVERWSHFLPTARDGLSYIREFQQLIDSNVYGERFVKQQPGRSWTRHLANIRRLTMTSPESKKRIKEWINEPRIRIDDYVIPEGGFDTFNDFFVRELKTPRTVTSPKDNAAVSSPADCLIEMLSAKITHSTLIQTKVGQRLKVGEMLADSKYAEKFIGGTGLRCILTPTDYHHYHSPVNGKIVESKEKVDGVLYGGVPGPAMIDNITSFQRGYYIYETQAFGYVAMVPVGLATIGSVVFEEQYKNVTSDAPVLVKKGDKVGHFEYGGSLVILVFEPGRFEMLKVAQGSKIGGLQ